MINRLYGQDNSISRSAHPTSLRFHHILYLVQFRWRQSATLYTIQYIYISPWDLPLLRLILFSLPLSSFRSPLFRFSSRHQRQNASSSDFAASRLEQQCLCPCYYPYTCHDWSGLPDQKLVCVLASYLEHALCLCCGWWAFLPFLLRPV